MPEATSEAATEPRRPGRYRRGSLEFERVAFFSDAVYAIAITLLVVSLDVPSIADATSDKGLWDALQELDGQVLMFFVSVAVIGSFWLGHHRFYNALAEVDRRLAAVNMAYLGLVAFLPFPAELMGRYGRNSVSVAIYAICIAALALSSVVLRVVATRDGLYSRPPTADEARWGVISGLVPAAVFLLSVPIAFIDPTLGQLFWLVNIPVGAFVGRRMPREVAAYYND